MALPRPLSSLSSPASPLTSKIMMPPPRVSSCRPEYEMMFSSRFVMAVEISESRPLRSSVSQAIHADEPVVPSCFDMMSLMAVSIRLGSSTEGAAAVGSRAAAALTAAPAAASAGSGADCAAASSLDASAARTAASKSFACTAAASAAAVVRSAMGSAVDTVGYSSSCARSSTASSSCVDTPPSAPGIATLPCLACSRRNSLSLCLAERVWQFCSQRVCVCTMRGVTCEWHTMSTTSAFCRIWSGETIAEFTLAYIIVLPTSVWM
mmetsp:Transcript_21086/g.65371  ORF Transcript_21086/g.65371 Transcript_21086/m.65371 type:complete len:265 (+) Transcript_21086:2093-2887(+)